MNQNSQAQRRPLAGREDIETLVKNFYEKVVKDESIGHFFTDVAKTDWNVHLPKMYNFWEDLLFGSENYFGRPFPPHIRLGLKPEHFERWLTLFIQTVDELYFGMKAEEVKARALRIAMNFQNNLQMMDK